MIVKQVSEVTQKPVAMPGASGCQVRWLIGGAEHAPNFAMRQFEVAPGGFTPRHTHPYEHEVFVLEGEGRVMQGDQPHAIGPGSVVLVASDELHQFINAGDVPLRFLCLIPNNAAEPLTAPPECGG